MKEQEIVFRLPECQLVEKKPSVRSRKVAQPYATEATMASRPIRLSQPV